MLLTMFESLRKLNALCYTTTVANLRVNKWNPINFIKKSNSNLLNPFIKFQTQSLFTKPLINVEKNWFSRTFCDENTLKNSIRYGKSISYLPGRYYTANNNNKEKKFHHKIKLIANSSKTTGLYLLALIIAVLGASYAAVPLYRLYCKTTGYGGTPRINTDVADIPLIKDRKITVYFESQTDPSLPWEFIPCQRFITVSPGEKVLAFYSAKNLSNEDITGFAIYNVLPDQVGNYFNKIQCFCFDEQRLRAKEYVYMPVYFFIDPDITKNKKLNKLSEVVLSYTFYLAQDQTYEFYEKEIQEHEKRQKELEFKYNL